MVKELRTQTVDMKLHRPPKMQGTQWNMTHVQPFFPPLETLFKTERLSNLSEYGVKLPEEVESIVDETHVKTTKGRTLPVHRKTTMVLSPYKTMKGSYAVPSLPKPAEVAKEMDEQTQSPHTAGYVGAMTSVALSLSGCAHFPRVYGVYTAVATKHELNISDDYEDLCDRKWFADQIGKTFDLRLRDEGGEGGFTHTRGRRSAVDLEDAAIELETTDLEAEHVATPTAGSVMEDYEIESSHSSEDSSDSEEDVYEIESCDCDTESEEEGSEEEEDDEPFAWATFKDVPVITTVMEPCEGTFYDLLKTSDNPEHHTAWVAQIVVALAFAQRTYGFVHNDLHGNNVMYVSTTQETLYYYVGESGGRRCYAIPTYGKLLKIIDFDRAAVSVKLSGMKEPRLFLSSQFKPDEEAGGQYNCEPFYDQTHPRIPLNPSFDLVRFATSVFWDMFPKGPDGETNNVFLRDLLLSWTTLPDGSSVTFRRKRDNHDRYHGFGLYKAIARYCKDTAVPRKELSKFKQFAVTRIPTGQTDFLLIEG
jgi:hypothetical protein